MRRSARIAAQPSLQTVTPPKRRSVDSSKTPLRKKKRSEEPESTEPEAPLDSNKNVKPESEDEDDVSTSGSEYDAAEDVGNDSDDVEMPEVEQSEEKPRSTAKKTSKKENGNHFTGLRKFTSTKGPTMHHSVPVEKAPSPAKEPSAANHHFSDGSGDEWEDVDVPSTSKAAIREKLKNIRGNKEDVQVTIISSEEQKWNEKRAKEMQLEINREKKKNLLNSHDVVLLCNVIHLRLSAKSLLSEDSCFVPACRSLIPKGYVEKLSSKNTDIVILKKFMKWFGSAFSAANNKVSAEAFGKKSFAERMELLVEHKCYDTSRDLAAMLFGCLASMDIITRFGRAVSFQNDEGGLQMVDEDSKKKKKVRKEFRDYFVEFWSLEDQRWIAVDPLTTVVDCPFKTTECFPPGFLYALTIDNKFGVRDVTARYAEGFLSTGFRRRRTGFEYLKETLRMPVFAANRQRSKAEDLEFHDVLSLRPLPTTLSDFKNHPLYVLEKDLLKFEAIYPRDQKPLGKVRGHDVFPRSAVHHLEGEISWIKEGRCVKKGEEPYKVVKARPKMNIPKEEREERLLNVYGFWQTEEYAPPVVKPDDPIPRNEYGNIYMYKPSMLPKGCVHLLHPGIANIAKKLQVDHVPAVVGWDFHGCYNHVILDGIVVHQGNEELLTNAWMEDRREQMRKVELKTKKRVMGNWKRLINGAIGLDAIRRKFGVSSGVRRLDDEEEEEGESLDDGHAESQVQPHARWMLRVARILPPLRFSSMASAQAPAAISGYESPPEDGGAISEFRAKFKHFKARKTEPDMTTVIKLREADPSRGLECTSDFAANYACTADELDSVGLKPIEEWTCTTLKHRPGLYVLSDLFQKSAHMTWMKRCLLEYAEPPNVTNLTAHHSELEKGVFEKMSNKLRWATLGVDYDWATKVYPEKPRAPLPKEMKTVANIVSNVLGLGPMNADAVIVNYYPGKSTLSAHVDRSERDLSRPLISLSFGQSAVYLTGGTDLNDPVDALYLQSGDVLVMHASQRLVYHAIPRIVKDRKFDGEGFTKELVDYANNNRINITIRQVD